MLPIFQYIPDTTTLKRANCCAIEYGDGFIHLCLINKENNSLIAQEYFCWEEGENNIWQVKDSFILIWVQGNTVLYSVFWHQPNFTLLPKSVIIDDSIVGDILFLLTGQKDGKSIVENVDRLKLRNIYISNGQQINILPTNNTFLEQHFITCWLETASKNNNEDKIQAIFYPHYFLIFVWKEEKLQLTKYIPYKTNEDVLYHLLYLTDFYALDKITIPVYVYGAIDLLSNLLEYLQQYFTSLKNVENLESYHFSEALLDKCPAHLSVPLLSLIPCV